MWLWCLNDSFYTQKVVAFRCEHQSPPFIIKKAADLGKKTEGKWKQRLK